MPTSGFVPCDPRSAKLAPEWPREGQTRRDGRADECAALEKPWDLGSRGFESHSLRSPAVTRAAARAGSGSPRASAGRAPRSSLAGGSGTRSSPDSQSPPPGRSHRQPTARHEGALSSTEVLRTRYQEWRRVGEKACVSVVVVHEIGWRPDAESKSLQGSSVMASGIHGCLQAGHGRVCSRNRRHRSVEGTNDTPRPAHTSCAWRISSSAPRAKKSSRCPIKLWGRRKMIARSCSVASRTTATSIRVAI
jgi:hypothetical protein